MVRDEAKLTSSPNLRVTRGIVDKSPDLAKVMAGHDVVINAAGNVAEASAFTKLVQTVIDATTASLGEGGRLWVFGGAALLTVNSADRGYSDRCMSAFGTKQTSHG